MSLHLIGMVDVLSVLGGPTRWPTARAPGAAQAALEGPLAGKAAHRFPPIDTPARHFMLRPAPTDGGKTRLNFFILHSAFRFGFSVTTRDVFSFPAGGRNAPSAARGAGGSGVYTPLKYGLLFLDRVFPL